MRPALFSSRNGLLAGAIAFALTAPESAFASSTITVSQSGDLHVSGKLPTQGFVKQEQVRLPDFLANRFGASYDVKK